MVTMDTGSGIFLTDGRTPRDPDTYRWPPRPQWGLPPGVLDVTAPATAHDGERIPYEDVVWTAWAFAGARCARTFWRCMGHRLVTARALADAATAVQDVLRWAQMGGWLPFEASKVEIQFRRKPRRAGARDAGLTMRLSGVDPSIAQAFAAGWHVAASSIADRVIADGSWR